MGRLALGVAIFFLSTLLWAGLPSGFESPDLDLAQDLDWVISSDGLVSQMVDRLADQDNPLIVFYSKNPIKTAAPNQERAAAMYNPRENIVLFDGQFRLIKEEGVRRLLIWRTWRHELWHVFNHEIRAEGFLSAEEWVGDAMLEESLRQKWARGLHCDEQGWELRENQTLRDIHYDACQDVAGAGQFQKNRDFSKRQIIMIEDQVGPYLQEPMALKELEHENPREAARIYYLLGLRFMANGDNPTREFARAVSVYR